MQEIKECKIDASDWIIDTIFIGGGTPSLLNENMIDSILTQLHKKYDLSNTLIYYANYWFYWCINLYISL